MSDPIKLGSASPGAFQQPTQPVENALVPAQTNPATAASSATAAAPQALNTPAAQAGGGARAASPTQQAGGGVQAAPQTLGGATQQPPGAFANNLGDTDADSSGGGAQGPAGPAGPALVIYWLSSQTWSQIAAQIPAPSTGKGAVIILADGNATYTLTAGSFNLDNVYFYGEGLTPDAARLTAAAGFNLNGSSTGNLFLNNIHFISAGTIVDTANSGGGINIVAINSSLNLVVDTFIADTFASCDLTLVDSEILGLAGGKPIRARANSTWNVNCQNSFIGNHIFHVNDGTPTLNLDFDIPTIVTAGYQDGFGTINGTIDGQNEIDLQSQGAVSVPSQIKDKSNGTATVVRLQATDNIASITLTTGYPGQQMVLILQQKTGDATPTWPNTITNVIIAGGTFAKTTTATAIDTMWLEYSAIIGKWLCLSYAKALA